MTPPTASVDSAEVARFAALAESWWDADGPFRALHQLNPVRLRYIRDRACAHFGRDVGAQSPLAGLRIADIGCGGGLLSEPMARLGARVVAADAAKENVAVAAAHAERFGLDIDYRHASAEDLAAAGERFDLVLAMEVIEHTPDAAAFVAATGTLAEAGGAVALATLNRTLKSFAFAILGAEVVLGWLPRGSHRWENFVRPAELARYVRAAGLRLDDLQGVGYDLGRGWRLGADCGVNYMVFAVKD